MIIKALDLKKYNHIKPKETLVKYYKDDNSKLVKLTSDELKSILSLIFAILYHTTDNKEKNSIIFKTAISEENPLITCTQIFGRQLIENLEGDEKEWLILLENENYELNRVLINKDLINFTQTTLIDYMTIRNFEYGEFFLKNFSKIIIDKDKIDRFSNEILTDLQKQDYPLRIIGEKITEVNSSLSTYEGLILAFVIKENLLKTKNNIMEYGLVNYIAKEHILILSKKIDIYKEIINKSLSVKWNLNRGKGKGGRRI